MAEQTHGPPSGENLTRPNSIPALERATGRDWEAWLEIFEAGGAAAADHGGIVRIARAAMPEDLQNPGWWAQGAAIAYEQHTGRRVPGQASDGTFRVGASRTLAMDRDAAVEAWAAVAASAPDHRGHVFEEPRRSRTDKRTFWRASLAGAGRVEAAATPKDDGRVSLAISQEGLPDGAELEQWRAHWKTLLAKLSTKTSD